jgi:hypothetical protein
MLITSIKTTEYIAIPPPIRKSGQFFVTVAVAIDFIWYIKSGQVYETKSPWVKTALILS